MTTFLIGGRIWIDDHEITGYLRTGDQPLTVLDGQVVFTAGGRPWTYGACSTPTGLPVPPRRPEDA